MSKLYTLLVLTILAVALSACGSSAVNEDGYPLQLELKGAGTVTASGLTCTSDCEKSFAPGTTLRLQASTAAGQVFAGWAGDCLGTTCDLVMDSPKQVSAYFYAETDPVYKLTVERAGEGRGRVTSRDLKIDCPLDCEGTYFAGFPTTLQPNPAEGFVFTEWSGGGCSGTADCTLTLSEATTVTATFGIVPGANTAPELSPIADQSLFQNTESTATLELPLTVSDREDSPDALTVAAKTDAAFITPAVSCDAEGGCKLTLEVMRTEAAAATVSVTATDSEGAAETAQFTLEVAPRLITALGDSGVGSLRTVLAEAAAGDVIAFDTAGIFASPQTLTLAEQLVFDKVITLQGSGAERLTLSGGDTTRLVYVEAGRVTLRGLTLANGLGQDGEGSRLVTSSGGAVVNRGELVLKDCVLSGHSADHGGALYNTPGASLTLDACQLTGNSAQSGGALFNDQGTVTISNSTFTSNTAARFGGVMYIYKKEPVGEEDPGPEPVVTIGNSTFSANKAQGSSVIANGYLGGAASGCPKVESACVPYAGRIAINDSVLENNLSEPTDILGGNGAVSNFGTLELKNSEIKNNTAPAGAGLYIQFKSSAVLDNVTVSGNRALDTTTSAGLTPGNGGGIYNEGTLSFINGTTVSNNAADNSGGGVFINGYVGTLSVPLGNSITGNAADAEDDGSGTGGGIYNEGANGIGAVAAGTVTLNTPNNIDGESVTTQTTSRLSYTDYRP